MYVNWPQWAQCRSSNSGSSTNSLNTTSGLQRIFDMPPRYRSRTIMAKFLGIYRGVENFAQGRHERPWEVAPSKVSDVRAGTNDHREPDGPSFPGSATGGADRPAS